MWVDMSPMRSSDALMRSALTTIRRSRATGCWRARIWIASSSSSIAAASMRSSSAMTVSARETFDSLNACVAFSMESATRIRDLHQAVLHLAQLLLEDLAHSTFLSFRGQRQTRPPQATLPVPG